MKGSTEEAIEKALKHLPAVRAKGDSAEEARERQEKTGRAWKKLSTHCDASELCGRIAWVTKQIVSEGLGLADFLGEHRDWGITDRSAERLAEASEKLADRLEEVSGKPLGRSAFPADSLPSDLRHRALVLRELPRGARRVAGKKALSLVTLSEVDLVDFVKAKTGGYHFEEVSILLDAACIVAGGTEGRLKKAPSYESGALEKRYKRFKKSRAAKMLLRLSGN
jgi:hypothetical protein